MVAYTCQKPSRSSAADDIKAMAGKPYEEIAFQVMRPFVGDTFSDDDFKGIIERAYKGFGHAARAPLVQLDHGHYLLELVPWPNAGVQRLCYAIDRPAVPNRFVAPQ